MAKTVFTQAYEGLSDIEELKIRLERSKEAEYLHLAGVTDAGKALTVNGIGQDYKTKVVITAEEQRAKDLYEELSFFDENALYFPGKDLLFFQSDIRGNAITIPRVRTLQGILQGSRFSFPLFHALRRFYQSTEPSKVGRCQESNG